ncbi:hypothetical protein IAT38_003513 [Cryptococcus sp. DSM 104549]
MSNHPAHTTHSHPLRPPDSTSSSTRQFISQSPDNPLDPSSASSITTTAPAAGPSRPTSAPISTSGGRPPRSRKNRPCDFCRRSKSRCSIGPRGPPCTQCTETKKACTFEAAPPPRKPRLTAGGEGGAGGLDDWGVGGEQRQGSGSGSGVGRANGDEGFPPEGSLSATRTGWKDRERGNKRQRSSSEHDQDDYEGDLGEGEGVGVGKRVAWARMKEIAGSGQQTPVNSQSPTMSGLDMLAAAVPTFDHLANSEYEPHVLTNPLTDDLLPIVLDNSNDDLPKEADRAHVKQISSDPSRPIFVVLNPKTDIGQYAPIPGAQALIQLRTLLATHPLKLSEASLIETYHSQVHPAWPILPNGNTSAFKPLLLATIIATSFSHNKDTRPLAALAGGLLTSGSDGQSDNNLAGVAAAILELGLRPNPNSRTGYMQLAKTIALAQLLGMHLNPLKWAIPSWERELRVRMWWCLAIHDAWMSFLNSRPCHIQAYNSTVPLPSLPSVLVASCSYGSASSESSKSFIASCKLSKLVCRLQAEVGTLGAVSGRPVADRKSEVKELSNLADEMANEWRDSFSGVNGGRVRATGVASFLIHLLGFRCMLRRIHIELEYGFGGMFDPGPDMLSPFQECVTFVSSLTEVELEGFFLGYASHILSSVTSSLIRLTLASPSGPSQPAMAILAQLIGSLHSYHSASSWDVAGPAIRRAAAVAGRLRGQSEHEELCEALLNGTTATPSQFQFDPSVGDALAAAQIQQPLVETVDPQLVWGLNGLDWGLGDWLNIPMTG